MTTNPSNSNRNRDWPWTFIIPLWILLFLASAGIGGTVMLSMRASRTKEAFDALTAQRDNLTQQLTDTTAKLTAATRQKPAPADPRPIAPPTPAPAPSPDHTPTDLAQIAKLTAERDAQTAKLSEAETQLAALTSQRNALIIQRDALLTPPTPTPAPPPVVVNPPAIPEVKVRPASETPLLWACQELKKDPTDANWQRVLGLAVALKNAVDKQLPAAPYEKPLDVSALLKQPRANPGRSSLLNHTRYVSADPPGPGQSYINTCSVFLDGPLVAAVPLSDAPRRRGRITDEWDGYILDSVVVVNGKITTNSYISNSIVIATGPIAVDAYILNSLVISLDSLPAIAAAPAKLPPAASELMPTVTVNSYISKSVVIGAVHCQDLRDCTILGRISGPEPYLRGATITSAVHVAQLPWQIDKPATSSQK